MTFNIIISFLFLGAVVLFAAKTRDGDCAVINPSLLVAAILGGAFILRIIMGYTTTGFETDINTFKSWAGMVNKVGYSEMYSSGIFLDYPPGYLYILGWLDGIRGLFSIEAGSAMFSLMIKLPSIIADIACGYIIYRLSKNRIGSVNGILLMSLYVFCPAVLINSTVWGQADSYTTLLLVISLWFLYKNKIVPAAVIYGLGVISKPQMLIFAPIYLFITIKHKNFKGLILGLISGFLTIMLVATPFIKNWDYLWLIDKYKQTMDFYAYYTVNAYNIWGMVGLNWKALPEGGILLFALNWAGPLIATVLCGIVIWKSKLKSVVIACPMVLMATVYMFSVKMHERYLFPVLLFMLLTYVFAKDKRFLYIFGGFSFLHFINVSYVLYLDNAYLDPLSIQIVGLSAAHLALYVYMMYVIFSVYVLGKTKAVAVKESGREGFNLKSVTFESEPIDRKIKKNDLIIIGVITLAYGIVAFWNLGVNISANTSWTPKINESVILKAGGEYSALTYIPGIAKNEETDTPRVGINIKIEGSDDGSVWTDTGAVEEGYVYRWYEMSMEKSYKYIKITALDESTTINEIGFKSLDGSGFLQPELVEGNGEMLLDEQNALPLNPSYLNSTYFDEIYHARTAYEHILGAEPYENTHPPLGKLIISAGIMIFGMNPFGWRVMGTLFGILMLPVLYHILKRLFGNKFLCAAGVILFAFDFMHYTQTRIATIDTYAVFFLLIMYDAMLVFIQMDIKKASIKKLLTPLFVSGIFMGIGIASKWTAAYGAIGLALLFFGKIIITYMSEKDIKLRNEILNKILTLCLWCMLIFIAIPFGIYFAAFLPSTTLPHNINNIFGSFWNYQETMFNYHSKLVAEHYFASPWYEWPLDIRNIWYYSGENVWGTGGVSTISCLGNPILWWSCLCAFIWAIYTSVKKMSYWFIISAVGFCAVFLPWVLVSRLTFVYHYFTAVPFVLIALVGMMSKLTELPLLTRSVTRGGVLSRVKIYHFIIGGFVAVNLAMFVVFFPVISGVPTTKEYVHGLEWLPNWYFIS